MKTPEDLKYSQTHEWVRDEGDGLYAIGITDFAQDALGSLVFVNLPEEGDELSAGEAFCDVESVKAASDVMSPLDGVVREVNTELEDAPERLNEDPYGAWIIRAEADSLPDDLMDADEYAAFCEEEA